MDLDSPTVIPWSTNLINLAKIFWNLQTKITFVDLNMELLVPENMQTTEEELHLIVRLRASDLSFYDGNVNNSYRRDRYANCDDPGEDIILDDHLFTFY